MSDASNAPKISVRHYQMLCGVALVAIFLLQMQQNLPMLANVLMLFTGALGVLFRARLTPILVLLCIALTHLIEQYNSFRFFSPDFRFLDLNEVLLCMAVLMFLIGYYRLQGIRFGVLPRPSPVAGGGRSEASLSPAELVMLIFPVPLATLAAEFAVLILRQHWSIVGLPPKWKQFLVIAWILLIAMFVAAQAFRYWRRLQMERGLAMMSLHDTVWNETRGEQRRIARWFAWRKLKDKTD